MVEQWRTGRTVPINVYAGDRPVCQCHTEIDAEFIVASVNYARATSTITGGETGSDLISKERIRQASKEGYTLNHDSHHVNGELVDAAVLYARPDLSGMTLHSGEPPIDWPWEKEFDKREKHSRIRQLTIAGALIAAEIDRLRAAA